MLENEGGFSPENTAGPDPDLEIVENPDQKGWITIKYPDPDQPDWETSRKSLPQDVRVKELTLEEAIRLDPEKGLKTGSEKTEDLGDELFARMKNEASKCYLVSWKGPRKPLGIRVGHRVIKGTDHGLLTSITGAEIGTYARLNDEEEDRQLLVYFSE